MTKLLSCAHCGGEAILLYGPFLADKAPYIICDGCEIQTAYCDTEAEAIDTWNKRVETDEWSTAAPGEYGRNPVTAEDVLRAAAQMRAEVEEMEKNLMTDAQREAMVLEMKVASLKGYVERQAATDKAERDLLATVAGDGYSYMVLWAFEGGEPYLVRMGKKKPLDTEEGS